MQAKSRRSFKKMLLLITLLATKAFAWFDTGHMVVAEIAYRNLDPKIVSQIDNLISIGANEYPKNATFATASVWPDDIHQRGIDFFRSWHYDERYISIDNTQLPNRNEGQALKMLSKNLELLSSSKTTQSEKAFTLKMIIHIVGDMHQPLHSTSRVSRSHPQGDRQGGLYKIKGTCKNLHSLWDSGLGHLPIFKRPLDAEQSVKFNGVVDEIMHAHPLSSVSDNTLAADFKTWRQEGFDLAVKHAYTNIPVNTHPNANYLHDNYEIAKKRIALAGYRLSNILNCAYGSDLCISVD